jgi:hypothetical protein
MKIWDEVQGAWSAENEIVRDCTSSLRAPRNAVIRSNLHTKGRAE